MRRSTVLSPLSYPLSHPVTSNNYDLNNKLNKSVSLPLCLPFLPIHQSAQLLSCLYVSFGIGLFFVSYFNLVFKLVLSFEKYFKSRLNFYIESVCLPIYLSIFLYVCLSARHFVCFYQFCKKKLYNFWELYFKSSLFLCLFWIQFSKVL